MFALKDASSTARAPEVAAAIDSVERYLLSVAGPQQFRKTRDAADAGADAAAYRGLAELGLTSALVPEQAGGSGLAPGVAALIGEQLGLSLAREPFVENVLLPFTLLQALGAPLPDNEIVCVAWQEGKFALPTHAMETKAGAEGQGLRLRGTKRYVMGARASTRLLVLASLEGTPAIVSIPASTAKRTDQVLADGSRWSDIELDTLVERSAVLGRGEACLAALTQAIDLANLALAGVLHGLQSRVLSMTLEYLQTREQFGQKLASFQALQHRAVDLYNHSQISRFLLGAAVDALDATATPATLAGYASRAKARASDSALRIAKEAIQMHGAIGFTDEYDLGLYVKRVLVLSAWLGNAAWHRRRHASLGATFAEAA